MPNYNILDTNNNVVNTIVAEASFMTTAFPLGNYGLAAVQPIVPIAVVNRRITRLAFRNRFTQSEKVAIEIAQLDNPLATMPQRAQAAALRSSQADVSAATYIDLDRLDTRSGVQALEAAGILASGRALIILDDPIQETEKYQG